MSAEILLKREQLDEVQRRAFARIALIIDHIVTGMRDQKDLVWGEVPLSPAERIAKVQDLATPIDSGLPSVLEKWQEIAPHHVADVLKQYQKDLRTLERV